MVYGIVGWRLDCYQYVNDLELLFGFAIWYERNKNIPQNKIGQSNGNPWKCNILLDYVQSFSKTPNLGMVFLCNRNCVYVCCCECAKCMYIQNKLTIRSTLSKIIFRTEWRLSIDNLLFVYQLILVEIVVLPYCQPHWSCYLVVMQVN